MRDIIEKWFTVKSGHHVYVTKQSRWWKAWITTDEKPYYDEEREFSGRTRNKLFWKIRIYLKCETDPNFRHTHERLFGTKNRQNSSSRKHEK